MFSPSLTNPNDSPEYHLSQQTTDEHQPHAKFTASEDTQLRSLVGLFGYQDWYTISLRMPGRSARQCKERWLNYLKPTLNTAAWTLEEDTLLLEKQRECGSRWTQITKFFPNRTDGMVKNRFNQLQRRETRVREVQLQHIPIALLLMHGLMPATPKPTSTRTQTQTQTQTQLQSSNSKSQSRQESESEMGRTEVIEEWTDAPQALDNDMDVWTDPLDLEFFDL
jgi:hypothetical protein